MKKTLITMFALSGVALADGTLVWDLSFSDSNYVFTKADGTTMTPASWQTEGSDAITDDVLTSATNGRTYFTTSADDSSVQLCNSFSYVVKANITDGNGNWPVLFGLGEASSWNLKIASYVQTGYQFNIDGEGYTVTKDSDSTSLTLNEDHVFVLTVDAGENDGIARTGTSAISLYVDGTLAATATLATSNRTTELLDTFTLGGRPYGNSNQSAGTFSNAQLYSGVLSTSQIHSLSVPEPATATLSLLALGTLALRRRRA